MPRILIIDDLFGSFPLDRRNFCRNFHLADVTGDDNKAISLADPIAEAVFCSGQIRENNIVRNDVALALESIRKGWNRGTEKRWALILLDLRFVSGLIGSDGEPEGQGGDDTFGLQILEKSIKHFPDIPVVVISSRDRAEVIEVCRKLGAADFIQRHEYGSQIQSPTELLKSKIYEHGLIEDDRTLDDESNRIVGRSVELLKVLRSARRAATGKGNILVLGETGTGKELLARYIHDLSPKRKGPYLIFHPFGRAEGLQEDELFGHQKGAYTGATSDREGLFEKANGGTIFIDEIGDIPDNLQSKLLRPLESRIVARQGGGKEATIDVQVIFATNKNLEEYAVSGSFRFDLLNRISAYPITIPPLREHKDDISLIAQRHLEYICKQNDARWPRKITDEAMQMLIESDWKDNVRGLRNILERAVKDNFDSELLMASDIRFTVDLETVFSKAISSVLPTQQQTPLTELIRAISEHTFAHEYSELHGKYPEIRKAIYNMMTNYLLASVEVTQKRKPGNPVDKQFNLTAAASCMAGQQLKTSKAADLIKKIIQMDKETFKVIAQKKPLLQEIYKEVLRLRPTKPK